MFDKKKEIASDEVKKEEYYQEALKFFKSFRYRKALFYFDLIGDYKDSKEMRKKAMIILCIVGGILLVISVLLCVFVFKILLAVLLPGVILYMFVSLIQGD